MRLFIDTVRCRLVLTEKKDTKVFEPWDTKRGQYHKDNRPIGGDRIHTTLTPHPLPLTTEIRRWWRHVDVGL